MSKSITKAERQAANRKMSAGVTKYIKKSVTLNGQEYAPKDIQAVLQDVADAEDNVDQLRLKLEAAVKAQNASQARAQIVASSLKANVISHYGDTSPVLAEFGFSARKVAVKSVAEKMLVVQKQLATRAARHTMGSQQKSSIHGDISSSTSNGAPAQTAPATAPVAAPIASAPSSSNGAPTNGASTNGANGATNALLFKAPAI
jgi:hypothetical protein